MYPNDSRSEYHILQVTVQEGGKGGVGRSIHGLEKSENVVRDSGLLQDYFQGDREDCTADETENIVISYSDKKPKVCYERHLHFVVAGLSLWRIELFSSIQFAHFATRFKG